MATDSQNATPPSRATKKLPVTEGAAQTSAVAGGADKASAVVASADTAHKATKAVDGVAANAAGAAAQAAVAGKGDTAAKQHAGRYAGAITSGAVAGASAGAVAGGVGALPGAAIGAAKNVAIEGGKDLAKGAGKITGGGPAATPADKKLGVGGTGYEKDEKKDDALLSKPAKVALGAGAVTAAPAAAGLVMLMSLLRLLKMLLLSAIATVANAASALWGFIISTVSAIGQAVAAPFTALGGMISQGVGAVLGISVTAALAPAAAVTSGVVAALAVVAMVGALITGALSGVGGASDVRARMNLNCVVNVGGGITPASVSADTEANARAVFSILRKWKMPDVNIAGILGNWEQESGIDPTAVEGIHDEKYTIGRKKQSAWDGNFTHIAGQSHGGIGLGQWSNGRTRMLLEYADANGVAWYTLSTQLRFMVDGDNPGDVDVFRGMLSTSLESPADAARYFHDKWERSADGEEVISQRAANAEAWFARMSTWTIDESAASQVDDLATEVNHNAGTVLEEMTRGLRNLFGQCDKNKIMFAGLVDGGMNLEQAQALVDLYNQEGDAFLDEKYGAGGGPGSCGDNHAMNCVSFSVYFVNKYTSVQQYPMGNGIDTAGAIASMTGKQLIDTPVPYSVASGPGTSYAGHTFVVLGVNGDEVIIGEAGYCAFMGRVRTESAAALQSRGWKFVDVSDLITTGAGLENVPGGKTVPAGG